MLKCILRGDNISVLRRTFSDETSGSKGWVSRILKGDGNKIQDTQSHSSLLSIGEAIYELQTHDAIGGQKERYLDKYAVYAKEVSSNTPGAEWFGSWFVVFGNQNQAINLWRYEKGYSDLDSHLNAVRNSEILRQKDLDYSSLCGRRRTILVKPFSYWGEPKERGPSHVYDLRSYVLKPGSMIEWGNAWSKGISYRKEYNQDVAGFFAQVGQLYMVFHIWAYKSMAVRQQTRQNTWQKPGWDNTVAYTVPLIKEMQSRILIPTQHSKLK